MDKYIFMENRFRFDGVVAYAKSKNGDVYKCRDVEPALDKLRAKLAAAEKRIEELENPPTCKNCETGKQVWREGKLSVVLCEVNSDNPERPTNRCWSYERKKEQ